MHATQGNSSRAAGGCLHDACNGAVTNCQEAKGNQENWCPLPDQPRSGSNQILPDWYWLGPYGPLDTQLDCHINPQTVECLNRLRRKRTEMQNTTASGKLLQA